jgi:hypothetical protein
MDAGGFLVGWEAGCSGRVSSACFLGLPLFLALRADGIAIRQRDPTVGAEVQGSGSFRWGDKGWVFVIEEGWAGA